MLFTFENVYEKRDKFLAACLAVNCPIGIYNQLKHATTKFEFMDTLYDEFGWVNTWIENFAPKFDEAGPFDEGLCNVRIGDLWGVIREDGSFMVQPE